MSDFEYNKWKNNRLIWSRYRFFLNILPPRRGSQYGYEATAPAMSAAPALPDRVASSSFPGFLAS